MGCKLCCTRSVPVPDLSAAARRRSAAISGYTAAEDVARAALRDGAPGARASALSALARMGALHPDDLLSGLDDVAGAVRRRACELAGRGRMAGVYQTVMERLADADGLVVEAACWALGELGPPLGPAEPIPGEGDAPGRGSEGLAALGAVVVALSSVAMGHGDPLCREAAVAALGATQAPPALAAILQALSDKPAIRRRAVLALASFEGEEVERALAKAVKDPDWQVRQAAEDLLGEERGR